MHKLYNNAFFFIEICYCNKYKIVLYKNIIIAIHLILKSNFSNFVLNCSFNSGCVGNFDLHSGCANAGFWMTRCCTHRSIYLLFLFHSAFPFHSTRVAWTGQIFIDRLLSFLSHVEMSLHSIRSFGEFKILYSGFILSFEIPSFWFVFIRVILKYLKIPYF